MAFLEQMLNNLVTMDFFQLLFPFLLALAIVYGVLMMGFKDRLGKGPIGLISIVIAFFVMLFAAQNPWLSTTLTNMSGIWLGIAAAVLFVIITLALLGIKDLTELTWKSAIIVLIVLYILITAFLGSSPIGWGLTSWAFNSEIWTVVAFVVILAVVMYFLGREGEGGGENKEEKK